MTSPASPGVGVGATLRGMVVDLDGTLLLPDETVSPRNQAAVRAALAAGWSLVVATARWSQMAEDVAGTFGVDGPVIACSGAQVRRGGEDLFDVRLPLAFAEALYPLCDAVRCVAWVGMDDEALLKLDGVPAELPRGMRQVASLSEAGAVAPRIALVQGTQAIADILKELEPEWRSQVRFVTSYSSSGRPNLALTATGADKGAALEVACRSLGLAPAEVVAFGDAPNDIEMFRVAGTSVAMGQASDEVKAAASMVTAPNTEDGVAQAIERLLG